MHPRALLLALSLSLAAPALAAPPAAPSEPTGIAAFVGDPLFETAKLSPKGSYLAVLKLEAGQRVLAILDLKSRKIASVVRPERGEAVGGFDWVSDERIVATLQTRYGTFAAPASYGEVYALDARTGNGRIVFGYRAGDQQVGSNIKRAESTRAWAQVIDTMQRGDDVALIAVWPWDAVGDRLVRLHKLDTRTGATTFVTQSPLGGGRFQADENGEPRLAYGSESGKEKVFLREPGAAWKEIPKDRLGLTGASEVEGIAGKDRLLYVSEPEEKGFRVATVHLDTGERKVVSRGEMAPARRILSRRDDRRVYAVEYEPDVPAWDFVDPKHPISRALQALLAAYPDDHVRFLDATEDGKGMVVHVYSDRNPGQLLLVDVEKVAVDRIAEVRPWVKPQEMSEQTAFHIRASDGLLIHGYLTLPRQKALGSPPPLVVLPHGGPHGVRDHWGFDGEVQLLASHGYAVLQVNFRGSGGYGTAYEVAGLRQWGGRMIEDLLDATRWAVTKGHVDGKRICTFGGSYGGYAAMQAAILAPDLFRCAVGYAGVYDLTRIAEESVLSHQLQGYWARALGTDEAALRAISPAHNAQKLKLPVLLVDGSEDRVAPLKHAKLLRDALEEAGNPPEWLVETGESHGFYALEAKERLYGRLLAFLGKHLGSPPAPAKAEAGPAR
jgi:dipeptidyl aminopeptidase/acylaminoacyl peptidase